MRVVILSHHVRRQPRAGGRQRQRQPRLSPRHPTRPADRHEIETGDGDLTPGHVIDHSEHEDQRQREHEHEHEQLSGDR